MKVKKAIQTALLFVGILSKPAWSADMVYCPDANCKINMDGHTIMRVWGVSGLANHALIANPDYDWPTESAIISWRDALLSARENGTCVKLYYDSASQDDGEGNTVHTLWSLSE
ncbi:MAG: hypothetical protein IPK84_04790 [Candidatus Moraniibacteriota bacterium]|nr:MAG: hypothetical protein IPK84_04790 [Candidatus Moranbacteria bacterium]